ncbi:MAG: PIN domain-containing protein [archaeon]
MAQKFYLDTAIWRDYFEDRKDNLRPLGEFAFRFLKDCEKKGCTILYSSLVVEELESHYSKERVAEVFSSFRHMLAEVPISGVQISEARKIVSSTEGTHLKDAVHAVLAKDNGATMIARDKHFEALTEIVEVAKPEDIHF